MADYQATSKNSKNFLLTTHNIPVGELVYTTWYSFQANILLSDHSTWQVEPKGFWDSLIEVKQADTILLTFRMGWKGIIIHTHFENQPQQYLLAMKGLLDRKFVLTNTKGEELVTVEADFKWRKFNFDFNLTTAPPVEDLNHKDLFLLTIIHGTNYFISMMSAAGA